MSIPVSNGVVDYEEYYELTEAQYCKFYAIITQQLNL